MLGSKSIMCGPAGPVVVFFSTLVKLTPCASVGVERREASGVVDIEPPDPVVAVARGPEVGIVVPGREQRVGDVEALVVATEPKHVWVRDGDGGAQDRFERVGEVELLHGVPEPVGQVHVLVVVGQQHVDRKYEALVGAEHLLELERAVTVVITSQPDRVRARRVDERAPDTALVDEAHLQGTAVGAQVGGLDHFLASKVPDRDLATEAGRVDTSSA
jgi:hypothetical protein